MQVYLETITTCHLGVLHMPYSAPMSLVGCSADVDPDVAVLLVQSYAGRSEPQVQKSYQNLVKTRNVY